MLQWGKGVQADVQNAAQASLGQAGSVVVDTKKATQYNDKVMAVRATEFKSDSVAALIRSGQNDLGELRRSIDDLGDPLLREVKGPLPSERITKKAQEMGVVPPGTPAIQDSVTLHKIAHELVQLQIHKIEGLREQQQVLNNRLSMLRTEIRNLLDDPLPLSMNQLTWYAKRADSSYMRLMELGDRYMSLQGIARNNCLTAKRIIDEASRVVQMNGDLRDPNAVLRQARKDLDAFNDQYALFLGERPQGPDEKRWTNAAEPLRKAMERIAQDLERTNYAKLIDEGRMIQMAVTDINTFVAVSNPVVATGDMVIFTYSITPRNKNGGPCEKEVTNNYPISVKGGWKFDFGTGLSGVFGVADDSYRLAPDPANPDRSIIEQNKWEPTIRPGLLATGILSPRWCKHTKPSLLTGLSIDMTDFSSGTIVLGPGISFGKEHIIGLHVGVAFTTAATLKRGLELGRSYETDTLDIAALTEDRFKQGWFVSLSYVISKQGKE
jgi:hypothetical protein